MTVQDIINKATTERIYLSQTIYDKETINENGQKCIQCHEEGKWYYQDEIPQNYMLLPVSTIGVRFDNDNDYENYGLSISIREHNKKLF